jgi:hypothetical protein
MAATQDMSTISFGRGSPGSLYLGSGWNFPETWGVKSAATVCEFILPLNLRATNCVIHMYCRLVDEAAVFVDEEFVARLRPTQLFELIPLELRCNQSHQTDRVHIKFITSVVPAVSLVSVQVQASALQEFNDGSPPAVKNPIQRNIRPVFIVGIPRAGTTITYKAIISLYQISNASLRESFYYPWAFSKFSDGWDRDCALAFLGSRLSGAFLTYLDTTPRPFTFRDITNISSFYYSLVSDSQGSASPVDKTPDHIFYWQSIFSSFVDARIIFCHRSAVDVFASMKKRLSGSPADPGDTLGSRWLTMDCNSFKYWYLEYWAAYEQCKEAHPHNIRKPRSSRALPARTAPISPSCCWRKAIPSTGPSDAPAA